MTITRYRRSPALPGFKPARTHAGQIPGNGTLLLDVTEGNSIG